MNVPETVPPATAPRPREAVAAAVGSERVSSAGDRSAGARARLVLRLGTESDRAEIYRLRHRVYALELGQHSPNPEGRLSDPLDEINTYLVICVGAEVVGFVSITPPGKGRYSIDKYFDRGTLPFEFDRRLYEVRLLTVPPGSRGRYLALALMYAAFRWVESRGGTRIVAIGRQELLGMYYRVGLKHAGPTVQAGAVTYRLLQTTMADVHGSLPGIRRMLDRIERDLDWQVGVPFHTPAPCYHGGAFFRAIGDEFDDLRRRHQVINADVLDAWFPPAPGVVAALRDHLPWLLRTSPPTACEGMVRAIARGRALPAASLLAGAGSSDLIYRAFPRWLTRRSRVLLISPSYGEYAHVVERIIGCRADRLRLARDLAYDLDPEDLVRALHRDYDLVVLVNPNNPTGRHLSRATLESILAGAPQRTRIWVDEAYNDYVGADESLEVFAARSEQVIVCKSMSKAYALSGARAAYLCAAPHQLEELRALTPPWAVSLPAQVAVVHALDDPAYYTRQYRETAALCEGLRQDLGSLGWDVVPSAANYLLCHLPRSGPNAEELLSQCCARGLFLRDVGRLEPRLGDRLIRVAVKDALTNRRMLEILRGVLQTESTTGLRVASA